MNQLNEVFPVLHSRRRRCIHVSRKNHVPACSWPTLAHSRVHSEGDAVCIFCTKITDHQTCEQYQFTFNTNTVRVARRMEGSSLLMQNVGALRSCCIDAPRRDHTLIACHQRQHTSPLIAQLQLLKGGQSLFCSWTMRVQWSVAELSTCQSCQRAL